MDEVVQKVSDRWLSSIDKEEPEIVDDFLQEMKGAISAIHKTEGWPAGKIANARNTGDDWLTKLVASNKKMQSLIPPLPDKENRVAVADS